MNNEINDMFCLNCQLWFKTVANPRDKLHVRSMKCATYRITDELKVRPAQGTSFMSDQLNADQFHVCQLNADGMHPSQNMSYY